MPRLPLLLILALLTARPALAAKLFAVLPLDVSHAEGHVTSAAQSSLEEMLRDVATDALGKSGWTVLSTQTQLQLLADNGVDAAKCGEENCQLSTAREIKADKFISGSIQFVDGLLTASFRLIDTASGRILAAERLTGKTATELRTAFEGKARAFFVKAGLVEDTAAATPPAPAAATDTTTLAGTTWSGVDPDAIAFSVTFAADGKLTYRSENGVAVPGTWTLKGARVSFDINRHYSDYNGTIKGTTMSGKARNLEGRVWDWSLDRD